MLTFFTPIHKIFIIKLLLYESYRVSLAIKLATIKTYLSIHHPVNNVIKGYNPAIFINASCT